jgi:signal transduction histidine kinase
VIANGLARDLGTALLQAQAYQEKAEAVQHLEEVNRVKTDFVSTVSHELRTPLTSITGYIEVLADETFGELTDRQRQLLDVVSRNGDRLMALIEDLLTLSRSDAGTLPVDRTEVDLAQVVAGAHRAASPLLAGRSLSLEVAPVEPVPGLGGDPAQLERVLLNLVSNAVKFTPDGGRVRVTTTATPTGVRLEVEDTGYGITEAELPHVFRRFYRTSTATERAIQGPGLGLAVVKTIVDEHGGSVDIRSAPGQGTSVVVTLPCDAQVAPQQSRALGRG